MKVVEDQVDGTLSLIHIQVSQSLSLSLHVSYNVQIVMLFKILSKMIVYIYKSYYESLLLNLKKNTKLGDSII